MAGPVHPSDFKEVLTILGAAGVVVPLFHRLRVSPVLGFMVVGMGGGAGPFGGPPRKDGSDGDGRAPRDYDFEGTAEEVPPQGDSDPRLPRTDRD